VVRSDRRAGTDRERAGGKRRRTRDRRRRVRIDGGRAAARAPARPPPRLELLEPLARGRREIRIVGDLEVPPVIDPRVRPIALVQVGRGDVEQEDRPALDLPRRLVLDARGRPLLARDQLVRRAATPARNPSRGDADAARHASSSAQTIDHRIGGHASLRARARQPGGPARRACTLASCEAPSSSLVAAMWS
jgi:hypothetical protein